jgi:hypothetical protein
MPAKKGNSPALKGVLAQGSKPSGSARVVPNAQYPTVLGTKRKAGAPPLITPEVTGPGGGSTTVNANPAK